MDTHVTESAREAAAIIMNGGIVAFPTETVYGLGADIFNEDAVSRIFKAKQRPADNPLIAHVGTYSLIEQLVDAIPDSARKLMDNFFPGPLTLVMPKAAAVPAIATAGLDTIGVRMPADALTNEFLRECGTPVAAPSANLSGRPSPTTWNAVLEDLEGRIDCILKGSPSEVGLESTVVDCTGENPALLRPGAITLEQLAKVVPGIREHRNSDEAPRSPGMKHRHYSPKASVVLVGDRAAVKENGRFGYIGLGEAPHGAAVSLRPASVEEYAKELFGFLRRCDREDVATIYCETTPETGIGRALMDRLRRAAE